MWSLWLKGVYFDGCVLKSIINVVNDAVASTFQAPKMFEVMPDVIVLAVKRVQETKLDG